MNAFAVAKRLIRSAVYRIPHTQAIWVRLNRAFDPYQRSQFSGWGMVTESSTPWQDGASDAVARDFVVAHQDLLARVAAGQFRLSMFEGVQHPASQIPKALEQMMWRHYIVFWSATYSAMATACPVKTLVECGVCDGVTVYFAMRALNGKVPFRAHLYDAWAGMKAEYLVDSERDHTGKYANLSVENTKRNLAEFSAETVFIKGYVPESFETAGTPSEVVWLHIDLNASKPTVAALNVFFDKMPSGAAIVFDDYARPRYHDTKIAVNDFLKDKSGLLLPLPTGQAVFFKHKDHRGTLTL